MNYQITFTSGSRQGQSFALIPNQALSIGRSHTNDVLLSEPDVSGRHVIIRPNQAQIKIEILSSKITQRNAHPLQLGDLIELTPGDTVALGEHTVFVLESAPASASVSADNTPTEVAAQPSGKPTEVILPSANADDAPTIVASNAVESPANADDKPTILASSPHSLPGAVIKSPAPVPEATPPASDAAVQPDKSTPHTKADDKAGIKTRMVSTEEIELIKKAQKGRQYRRVLLIALPVMLFLVLAIFSYFYLRPETEEYLSWPTDDTGKFLNEFKQTYSYLALIFPKTRYNSVKTQGQVTEIFSRLGKQQDVLLHIVAVNQVNPTTLTRDHDQAFQDWCDETREKNPSINWGGDQATIFIGTEYGAGVPLSCVSYTRRVGNDDFFGFALFVRNHQNLHTTLIEVPLSSRWRAEKFLRLQVAQMFIYAVRRIPEHWEGSQFYRASTPVAVDIEEAQHFMTREAPVYWGKIFYRLRSALIKAKQQHNNAQVNQALRMLQKLRKQQTTWYNTQKLAYQFAVRNNDKLTMDSIQATCDSIFSAEFQQADFRYELIKRKDWK